MAVATLRTIIVVNLLSYLLHSERLVGIFIGAFRGIDGHLAIHSRIDLPLNGVITLGILPRIGIDIISLLGTRGRCHGHYQEHSPEIDSINHTVSTHIIPYLSTTNIRN